VSKLTDWLLLYHIRFFALLAYYLLLQALGLIHMLKGQALAFTAQSVVLGPGICKGILIHYL